MLMYTPFEGGGGSMKVYIVYTHLNIDNYGWPLSRLQTWYNDNDNQNIISLHQVSSESADYNRPPTVWCQHDNVICRSESQVTWVSPRNLYNSAMVLFIWMGRSYSWRMTAFNMLHFTIQHISLIALAAHLPFTLFHTVGHDQICLM